MNIVSVLVGITIAGTAMPTMVQMTLAPVIAQKRATNLGEAEALAVSFAAANEGQPSLIGDPPNTCDLTQDPDAPDAYTVSCSAGENNLVQTVARSFRLEIKGSSYTNPTRSFAWETPGNFSHVECPVNDPWGVGWYNAHLAAGHLGACIPSPVWSRERYLASSPDDWLFDLSDWGYGRHPNF
jgi:hypothetical protein